MGCDGVHHRRLGFAVEDSMRERSRIRRARKRVNAQEDNDSRIGKELAEGIENVRAGGRAIDPHTQVEMKAAFGHDFARVRVHTGDAATQLNRAMAAEAFTEGEDLFIRDRQFDERSATGKSLLAHELAHVVQRDVSGGAPGVQGSRLSEPSEASEQEAVRAAAQVMEGQTVHLRQGAIAENVVFRRAAKESEKEAGPDVDLQHESEMAELVHGIIHGTHYLGGLAEITEIFAELLPYTHLIESLAAWVAPIGAVAEVILIGCEGYKAYQTYERISQAMGACYGVMWQALGLPDQPLPPDDDFPLSAEERERGKRAFARGVSEGRAVAKDPVKRNRILVAIAQEDEEGEWWVLNFFWRHAMKSEPLRDTYIPWPKPGYAKKIR